MQSTKTDTRPYMIGNSQGLIVRENQTRGLGVDSKRKSDERIRDSVTEQQEAAVQSLLDTRKQPWVSGHRKSPHSFSSSHVASASGKAASMFIFHFFAGSMVSVNNASVGHSRSNNATVEMAIADSFHCENKEWDVDRVLLGVLPFSPDILKLVILFSNTHI